MPDVPAGPLSDRYAALGGAQGLLGSPVDVRLDQPAGGAGVVFDTGYALYWSAASGAWFVHGGIRAHWEELGGPAGPLGYPCSDETGTANGGYTNAFQNGYDLWWTQATGAHFTHGGIAARWRGTGGPSSPLGFPTTDETATAGGGYFNDFAADASIVWSADTGAWVVRGAIRQAWLKAGGAGGQLGFPVADETPVDDGAVEQIFQHGVVRWTQADGAAIKPPPPPSVEMLRILGQRLADAIAAAYPGASAIGDLAFLPAGVAVPNDLVQGGVLNPTQLQTWLEVNFDSPFVVSPASAAVLQKDPSYGTATQIYEVAVGAAQPAAVAASDAWSRLAGEIASAKASYGPPGALKPIVCMPGDWPVDGAGQSYWIGFQASSSDTAPPPPPPSDGGRPVGRPIFVRPDFWRLREFAQATDPAPSPPPPTSSTGPPREPPPVFSSRFAHEALATTLTERVTPLAALVPASAQTPRLEAAVFRRGYMPARFDAQRVFANAQVVVPEVSAAPTDTVTISLEHQMVTLAYLQAGQPWWNGTFLNDAGWYVAGMGRGGLLPPRSDLGGSTFGLPIALVIVRNLQVTGSWSAAAASALQSGAASLGPLSLAGVAGRAGPGGVGVTYPADGMQVVAMFCSRLPVLPPVDAPGYAPPASAAPASPPVDAPAPADAPA